MRSLGLNPRPVFFALYSRRVVAPRGDCYAATVTRHRGCSTDLPRQWPPRPGCANSAEPTNPPLRIHTTLGARVLGARVRFSIAALSVAMAGGCFPDYQVAESEPVPLGTGGTGSTQSTGGNNTADAQAPGDSDDVQEPEAPTVGDCASCAEAGYGCAAEAYYCLECLKDSDCLAANSTCIANRCETATSCATVFDCSLFAVCNPNTERCVECVSRTDCDVGERCKDGVCLAECEADDDCPRGRCDVNAGRCVECFEDVDCAHTTDEAVCWHDHCVIAAGAPAD
jgi:hypothetical protein